MTVVVRRAVIEDAPALVSLARAAYAGYLPRMPEGLRPGPMDADYADRIARADVRVAVDADEIIAFIVLVAADDHLLLENVAVHPEWQGRGVGRRLLDLAEQSARRSGLGRIALYTHVVMVENQRLYAALGYRETHRRTDEGFERVFYEKLL